MQLSDLDSHILFEDDAVIVLDKPAGWVVNRSHTYTEPTVQEWMEGKLANVKKIIPGREPVKPEADDEESIYGTPEEIFARRSGVVHRLDKDTSGILLLAKTPQVLVELMRQFKERETEKTYVALVHGKLVPSEGIIRLPMDRSSSDHMKFAIQADGRMSETQYKVLEHFPGLPKGMHARKGKSYQGFTLVELTPKTGRTHQIRVHMSAIKHPLVSDALYAGKKIVALDLEWCPRQFLHAKKLCFTHPVSKERVCFESPLPQDLRSIIDHFQEQNL
jgi:23S rRNA pseudouridine1911/1915/1917 synthase